MAGNGRQTKGRQRILIRRIASQDDLYATYSKRRQGLYKKASELSTLCGVFVGIIIFSPTDNPYSFFHPNMESVVNRYRNLKQQNRNARVVESTIRSRVEHLSTMLDEILEEKEQLKQYNKYLEETEEIPIESLNKQQVKERMNWFHAFEAQVESKIEELKNGRSTSAVVPGPSTEVGLSTADMVIVDPSSDVGSGNFNFYPPPLSTGVDFSGHISCQPLTPPPQDPSQDQTLNKFFLTQFHNPLVGGVFSPHTFQDMQAGGGRGRLPGQMFQPSLPLNPSSGGGTTQSVPVKCKYIPPMSQNLSTNGENGEVASSCQE